MPRLDGERELHGLAGRNLDVERRVGRTSRCGSPSPRWRSSTVAPAATGGLGREGESSIVIVTPPAAPSRRGPRSASLRAGRRIGPAGASVPPGRRPPPAWRPCVVVIIATRRDAEHQHQPDAPSSSHDDTSPLAHPPRRRAWSSRPRTVGAVPSPAGALDLHRRSDARHRRPRRSPRCDRRSARRGGRVAADPALAALLASPCGPARVARRAVAWSPSCDHRSTGRRRRRGATRHACRCRRDVPLAVPDLVGVADPLAGAATDGGSTPRRRAASTSSSPTCAPSSTTGVTRRTRERQRRRGPGAWPSTASSSTSSRPAIRPARSIVLVPRLPRVRPLVAPPDRAAGRRRLPRAGPRPARLRPVDARRATSTAYGIDQLAGDLLGLLDDAGADDAVFVGHDWGALLVWDLARLHPERVRAVVASACRTRRGRRRRPTCSRRRSGDRFFYILYFQAVGPAEAELEPTSRDDAARSCGRRRRAATPSAGRAAAAGRGHRLPRLDEPPRPGARRAAGVADRGRPRRLRRPLRGQRVLRPGRWYRNLDANHAAGQGPPAAVDADVVHRRHRGHRIAVRPGLRRVDGRERLPDLRGTMLIDGAGHWTQQEAPDEFNRRCWSSSVLPELTPRRWRSGCTPAASTRARRPSAPEASGRHGCRPTTRTG